MAKHLFAPGENISYCGLATVKSNAAWETSKVVCYSCSTNRLDKILPSTRRLIKTFYVQNSYDWGLQTKLAKMFGISRQRVCQIVHDPKVVVFDIKVTLDDLVERKDQNA